MHDDDATPPEAIEGELQAVIDETARLYHELDAIEAGLTQVVEMFLQHTGRSDLALDFLRCLAAPRGTLH